MLQTNGHAQPVGMTPNRSSRKENKTNLAIAAEHFEGRVNVIGIKYFLWADQGLSIKTIRETLVKGMGPQRLISMISVEKFLGCTDGRYATSVVTDYDLKPGVDYVAWPESENALTLLKGTRERNRGHYQDHEIWLTEAGFRKVVKKVRNKAKAAALFTWCEANVFRYDLELLLKSVVQHSVQAPETPVEAESTPVQEPSVSLWELIYRGGAKASVWISEEQAKDFKTARENPQQVPVYRLGNCMVSLPDVTHFGPSEKT